MSERRLNLDPAAFLAQYWQQEHLFIAQGATDFCPPADADELAGLAMEPGVDSRIVRLEDGAWHQQLGPFTADDFQRKSAWSLLVHGVDHHWDEAAALLQLVDWLPRWRFDNVLMSYATDGGSAAPHFDRYDVFIIQGEGQRRWRVGDFCDANTPLLEQSDASILADFSVREEYLMQTGDVLYLPPGCSHYGVSLGESTSFSIGFRAPRLGDLLAQCVDELLAGMDQQRLLTDNGRSVSQRAGEISVEDLQRARLQIAALLRESGADWLGEVITGLGTDESLSSPPAHPISNPSGESLRKTPEARMAWYADGEQISFYANGSCHRVELSLAPLIEALCADRELAVADVLREHPSASSVLAWLQQEGAVQLYD